MRKALFILFFFAFSLFAGTATYADSVIVDNATPTASRHAMLSKEKEVAVLRLVFVTAMTCSNIYPAPKDFTECFNKIRANVMKSLPGAANYPDDPSLAQLFAGGGAHDKMFQRFLLDASAEPEFPVLVEINQRVYTACVSEKDFAQCMEKANHLVASSFDPHTGFITAETLAQNARANAGSFPGIGAELIGGKQGEPIIVVNLIDGSPAKKAGLLPGDLIVGVSADGTIAGMKPAVGYKDLSDVVNDIRGKAGTSVLIEVSRIGEQKTLVFTIVRGTIDTPLVKTDLIKSSGKTYGFLKIREFSQGVCRGVEEGYQKILKDANNKLDGLIVSVENNPGGYLHEVQCILDRFSDAKSYVLQRDREGITEYVLPCETTFFGAKRCQGGVTEYPGDMTNGLPILVMVNGGSASASEIFAVSMKHTGRGVVGGTTSFKKGTAQSVIPVPGGGELHVTGYEFLIGTLTDWVPVQCVGVTPDIIFERNLEPKDENGNTRTECSLNGSLSSLGEMTNPPVHQPIAKANPTRYASGVRMLNAYKNYVAPQDADRERAQRLLKERFESLKKEQKNK